MLLKSSSPGFPGVVVFTRVLFPEMWVLKRERDTRGRVGINERGELGAVLFSGNSVGFGKWLKGDGNILK